MNRKDLLASYEDHWVSTMGGWYPGKRVVYRGNDLHRHLKDMNWMELYLFGITGRRFNAREMKIFNAMWTYTSFPEPRLWNNRVTALAGTVKTTATLALGAGITVSEASIYGHKPNTRAIDFLLRTNKAVKQGEDLLDCIKQELKTYRTIFGYGRPLNRDDERNPYFIQLVREQGMDKGEHFNLALTVDKVLSEGRWRMKINITGLDAALSADMGLTPRQHHLFMTPCFLAGMPPCFIESNERPEGVFFPLRCERIAYEGHAKREW